ncbi:hypothetical protein [Lacticaseibacillus pantheris]|uniref:hypothetical protein n=1 Tax=Lacticaseibacillus pantheris TaxID=171523 RepID=UPI0034E2B3E2
MAFVYVKKTVHPTFTSDTALMVNIEASGKDDSQLTVQQAEVQKKLTPTRILLKVLQS